MNHGTVQYIALLHHMIYHHSTSLLMIHHTSLLVGGIPTPEKYEFVKWEYFFQLNGKS